MIQLYDLSRFNSLVEFRFNNENIEDLIAHVKKTY